MGMSIAASSAPAVQIAQPISAPPAPVAPKTGDSGNQGISAVATQSLALNTEGLLGTLLNMST